MILVGSSVWPETAAVSTCTEDYSLTFGIDRMTALYVAFAILRATLTTSDTGSGRTRRATVLSSR